MRGDWGRSDANMTTVCLKPGSPLWGIHRYRVPRAVPEGWDRERVFCGQRSGSLAAWTGLGEPFGGNISEALRKPFGIGAWNSSAVLP